ncbi:hypothetical protein E4T44_05334 [Aureobasidium sp. EXF-8845]|nr:hypothetical protein E4T44_05334 [Aureobasidium sp. EXF-8845]KAI4850969.1 hypothetical protein E4T45_05277 [Aureobasidium sp. EXF-8846]
MEIFSCAKVDVQRFELPSVYHGKMIMTKDPPKGHVDPTVVLLQNALETSQKPNPRPKFRPPRKRKLASQPQQPILKKVFASRKPLSNAANTLGKTRDSNTAEMVAKQTPARVKPPTKPSTPKLKTQASPPTRSTTTRPIILKPKIKLQRTPTKAMGTRTTSKKAAEVIIPPSPPPIKYKLTYVTRWELQTLSNDDTTVFDTNTSWIEVMKGMDLPIHTFCRANGIYNQMPYKIKALVTSARPSRPKETNTITLEHARAEPRSKVIDLVHLNYSNGLKDISIVINSVWTPAGIEPLQPQPAATITEPESAATSRTGKRTERSLLATSEYQEARGLFWNEVISFWTCPSPLTCKVKARLGIACWVRKGRYYEITYSMAPKWREAIDDEGDDIRHPPRSIRRLIKREDEKLEADHWISRRLKIHHLHRFRPRPQCLKSSTLATNKRHLLMQLRSSKRLARSQTVSYHKS